MIRCIKIEREYDAKWLANTREQEAAHLSKGNEHTDTITALDATREMTVTMDPEWRTAFDANLPWAAGQDSRKQRQFK